MLSKPEKCKTCLLYQDGTGFVPDELIEGSQVMIIGQNPGKEEIEQGKPFVGVTGRMLEHDFLPLANLERGKNVSLGNSFRCRWNNSNELPPMSTLNAAIHHCTQSYLQIPESIKLIVLQGATAFRRIGEAYKIRDIDDDTGKEKPVSIENWRGHLLPWKIYNRDALVTLHIADLLPNRNPKMSLPTKSDFRKIPKYLNNKWPSPLPDCVIIRDDTLGAMQRWFQHAFEHAPYIVVDTEYTRDTKVLTLVGMCYPGMLFALQFPWISKDISSWLRSKFIQHFAALLKVKTSVYWNVTADAEVIEENLNINHKIIFNNFEDAMLAHHILWCELPHKLEFVISMYGEHRKMKHLAKENPLIYNLGDIVETQNIWEKLKLEFKRDPASERVYREQSLPLVPIIFNREKRGIRVNAARVTSAIPEHRKKVEEANLLGQSYCGYPINMGSPKQLQHWFYTIEGLSVQKHKDTKQVTINDDAVNRLRLIVGPAFDPDIEMNMDVAMERIEQGANTLLEAKVLGGKYQHELEHYLEPLICGK